MNNAPESIYSRWAEESDRSVSCAHTLIMERTVGLSQQLNFRVIIDVRAFRDPRASLRTVLHSLDNQLYRSFEICVLYDTSHDDTIGSIWDEAGDKRSAVETVQVQQGMTWHDVSVRIGLRNEELLLFVATPGRCSKVLLNTLLLQWNQCADTGVVYFDEEALDGEGTLSPLLKKGWDPRLILASNYVGYAFATRADCVENAGHLALDNLAWPYGLLIHTARALSPVQVVHLPYVLFCQDGRTPSVERAGDEAQQVRHFLSETHQSGSVRETTKGRRSIDFEASAWPKVSVIIPTRDCLSHLGRVCDGLWNDTNYAFIETIIVDNGSREQETLDFLDEAKQRPDVTVLRSDTPFNFSALNNLAVEHSSGDVLLLLNNDVEIIEPDWLLAMVREVLQPGVGAVGALLLYPDRSIQHAGIVLGARGGIAGHLGVNMPEAWLEDTTLGQGVQNVSAVTAACMATNRKAFDAVGGLDENLAVDYNDVDYCLKLKSSGFRVLFCPHVRLIHHESVSRGPNAHSSLRARDECERMTQRWSVAIQDDIEYVPTLALEEPGFLFTGQMRVPPLEDFLTQSIPHPPLLENGRAFSSTEIKELRERIKVQERQLYWMRADTQRAGCIAQLNDQIDSITRSKSWKLTAPLRAAVQLARTVGARARALLASGSRALSRIR